MKEYSSIRKSVQKSIALFNQLKDDLKPTTVPSVPAVTSQADINAIMRRSQHLRIFLNGCSM